MRSSCGLRMACCKRDFSSKRSTGAGTSQKHLFVPPSFSSSGHGNSVLLRVFAAVSVTLLLAVAVVHSSWAHNAANFYDSNYWKASAPSGLHITWRFSPGFPDGGPKKNRVIDAFNHWNALDQQMDFTRLSDATSGYEGFLCIDQQGYNGIFFHDISPPAITMACPDPGTSTLHNFFIRFDSSRRWHGLDDTNVPDDEIDLESFATHEVGHATGWGGEFDDAHFDEDSGHCPGGIASGRHTMCDNLLPGIATWRSLESHDKQAFDDWYPDD